MIELTPVALDISNHPKSKRHLASSIFCQLNHKLKAGPLRAQQCPGDQGQTSNGGARRGERLERLAILDNTISSAAPNSVSVSDCPYYSLNPFTFSSQKTANPRMSSSERKLLGTDMSS